MKRLIFLLLIVSCQGQSDSTNQTIENSEEPLANQELFAYCFYKLDDKYCEISDPKAIENWQENKGSALTHHDIRGNLFEHKGGGPNGSEWNPSTSIYIVVNQYPTNFRMMLNDLEYDYETSVIGGYTWICVSQSEWEDHLVTITDQDWKAMFPEGPVEEAEDFGFENAIQPPKIGQILKFTFVQEVVQKDYFFYAAFGE